VKRTRKLLTLILSLLCVFCFAVGATSCGKDFGEIETLDIKYDYRVEDSIDVYDLFKYKEDQNLTFEYKIDDGENVKLVGEMIYLKVAGLYQITATSMDEKTATVEVQVYDKLSYMYFENDEMTVDFETSMGVKTLINRAAPTIMCEVEHREYVEQVKIYKIKNQDPIVYDIQEGKATADGFFDGKKFKFIYECDYEFRIYSETSGGRVYFDLTVHAIEDVSGLSNLLENGATLSVDIDNYTASWSKIAGATKYRVKFAGETKVIEDTNIDFSEYIIEEFYHFDFMVIPVDAEGEKIGKMVREDFIVAPDNSKDVILGGGVSSIDGDNMTVTLAGKESAGCGFRSEIHPTLDNSFIAFCNNETGKYGIGYVAEFNFKGNNMPQLCFFTDALNGDITSYGGNGYLFMNGMYAVDKYPSRSTTNVVGEGAFLLLGPNRIDDTHKNYMSISEDYSRCTVSKNTLLTQKFLREEPNREFNYKVRSFDSDGYLAFEILLSDAVTGDVLVGPITRVTETAVDDVKPGYIIAYATVKGADNDTTFSYKLPYEYVDNSDQDAKTFGAFYLGEQNVLLSAGSHPNVSSQGGAFWDDGWVSGISKYVNSYVAFENASQVGKYIDIFFTGNNMPIVTLFANEINTNMGGTTYTTSGEDKYKELNQNGYVLIGNGVYDAITSEAEPKNWYLDENFYVYGPNRISQNPGQINNYNVATVKGTYSKLQDGIDYKYTVGTREVGGLVVIEMKLYNTNTNELIVSAQYNTEKTVTEAGMLGNDLILYAGVKGNSLATTFRYSDIYDFDPNEPFMLISGGVINADGSVTLNAGSHPNVSSQGGAFWDDGWVSGISKYVNSYVAFENVSKVGKYIDIFFTGNNMPLVTFFANAVNSNMGGTTQGNKDIIDQNGYLISNGLFDAINDARDGNGEWFLTENFYVFGPNRISTTLASIKDYNVATIQGSYSKLQDGIDYKYTVGTREAGGLVVIEMKLYNANTNKLIVSAQYNTEKTATEVGTLGNDLILYAGVKGNSLATTFRYTDTYDFDPNESLILISGGSTNADGSITLNAGKSSNVSGYTGAFYDDGWKSDIGKYVNTYVGFDGGYTVGKYIDFTFKGNNMPIVTLFANAVNSAMSGTTQPDATTQIRDQNGYLISNGGFFDQRAIYVSSTNYTPGLLLADYYYVFGPNRIDQSLANNDGTPAGGVSSYRTNVQCVALQENVEYKYTVGSKLVSDKVVIVFELYKLEGSSYTEVYKGSYETNKTQSEVEALGNNLIAYAGVKGYGEEVGGVKQGYKTTFKFSDLYYPQ